MAHNSRVYIYLKLYIYYTIILWRCACKQFLPAIFTLYILIYFGFSTDFLNSGRRFRFHAVTLREANFLACTLILAHRSCRGSFLKEHASAGFLTRLFYRALLLIIIHSSALQIVVTTRRKFCIYIFIRLTVWCTKMHPTKTCTAQSWCWTNPQNFRSARNFH